ncbi:DUF4129 domain-containing protein [Myxococcota bacterium]|nr:DUF4129 domain-containing protein [Myxococcota bacterium]
MLRVPAATVLSFALASCVGLGVSRAQAEASPAADDAGRVRAAVTRTVVPSNGYRLHFPGEEPPGDRTARLPERARTRSDGGLAAVPVMSLGARLLLWALGAAALVFLAIALWRAWRQRGAPETGGGPGPGSGPLDSSATGDARGSAIDVSAADALAARGDLAGAIHLLLRVALRRLHGHAEPPPAWTARAALARLPLVPERRACLRILVEAVERTRYAGIAPDAETYARCRAASESL